MAQLLRQVLIAWLLIGRSQSRSDLVQLFSQRGEQGMGPNMRKAR